MTEDEDVFGTVPQFATITKAVPVVQQVEETVWTTENIVQQQTVIVTERIEQTQNGLATAEFANESLRAGAIIAIDAGTDASFVGLSRATSALGEILVTAGRDVVLDGAKPDGAAADSLAAVADLRAGLTVSVSGGRDVTMKKDAVVHADDGDATTETGVIRLTAGQTLTVQSDSFGGHEVYLHSGGDVLMQSKLTSGHLIDVQAGLGPAGIGSVITNIETDLETLGSEIHLSAGAKGGNLLLTNAQILTAGPITLAAPAGSLVHSGGQILADSLSAVVKHGITANLDVRTVSVSVTGSGDVNLTTSGPVTLANVTVASGSVAVEGFGDITVQNVSTQGGSGGISLTGLQGNLTLGNISASGTLDVQSDLGQISSLPGTTVAANEVNYTGQLADDFAFSTDDVTLITRSAGDVVINYTGSGPLTLRQVYVLAGSLIVNTPGDLIVLDARLLSNTGDYSVQLNAGGNVIVDHLDAGDYAATATDAAAIRSARGLAADAPLTSLNNVTITAAGAIREAGSGDDGVDIVANRLTLSAGTGISGLKLSANELLAASTTSGSITLSEVDGSGELSSGLLVGTLTAPAGIALTTASGMTVSQATATNTGADIRLIALDGPLTVTPLAGQTQMLTAGGDIELRGIDITWAGTNSAGDNVTVAASGNLLINSNAFSLTSDSLSMEAAENLAVGGSIAASGTVSFVATAGNQSNAADIVARSGASIQNLTFTAGRDLNLLDGSFPTVTNSLTITAGRQLAQSDVPLSWIVTGSNGELIVSAGGDLAIGHPELLQSVLKANRRISISSVGYLDDHNQPTGGNLAVISIPAGYNSEYPRNLHLYAQNYLHLHEGFFAPDSLVMRGGQTVLTRRAILRNLASQMRADGPADSAILDAVSRSVTTVRGTKLELQEGTILRLEQHIGSGDQFASDTEIVLTSGDIIVRVDPADPRDGDAETNRNVVAPNTTMAGALTGTGSLVKRGDGVLELGADNTYTGRTVVEAGKLIINGSTAPQSNVEVLGGTLAGSGTIQGSVTVASGAFLSPGNSPGILTAESGLNLIAGSTYLVDVAGSTAGTGYDQTNVTGTVNVGGAILSLNFTNFSVADGGEYIIINNDGSDDVIGRFAGLPDGTIVSSDFGLDGKTARISYHAGDGNDVSLIVDEQAPHVALPSGGDVEFEFRMAEKTLQILINSNVLDTFVLDGIESLSIGGRAGQRDILRLNFEAANAELLRKLTTLSINLGGDANDDLYVNVNNSDLVLTHSGVGAGSLSINSVNPDTFLPELLSLPFTGVGSNTLYIENTDDLTMTFGNTADSIVFTDSATAGYTQVAGTNFTTTQFLSPVSSLTITLGTNSNSLTVTSMDATFNPTNGMTIQGGAGDNTFNFASLGSAFTGALSVLGQAGTDSATFTSSLTTSALNVQTETSTITGINLTTSGGDMSFGGNVVLSTGAVTLNTTGGNLSIAGTLSGNQNLTLAAGIGAGNTTIDGNVSNLGTGTGAALTIGSGITGLVRFNGTVAANSGLVAGSSSSNLWFTGNVTLGDGTVGTSLPGSVRLDGLTFTGYDQIVLGTTTLSGSAVSITSNNSNITFTGTVDGAQDLTLTAGTGNISIGSAMGSGTALGDLTIVSANDFTVGGSIRALSVTQTAGSGTTTLSGSVDATGPAGVSITANQIVVSGSLTATGTGPMNLIAQTTVDIAIGADLSTNGPVSITGPDGITLGGNISTSDDAITFIGDVQLLASVRLDSGTTGATISFNQQIEGTTANTETLTLDAGTTGQVSVSGSIGRVTSLNSLILVNSNGATFGTTDDDTITATTATQIQNSQSGAMVMFTGGLITSSLTAAAAPYDLHLAGSGTVIGVTSLLNTGTTSFGDTTTDVLLFTGPVTAVTQSAVRLFGIIHTEAHAVVLGDADTPVHLFSTDSVIDTTADAAFPAGANITIGGQLEAMSGVGGENLRLDAGTSGDILFVRDIGNSSRIGTLRITQAHNATLQSITAETFIQEAGTGTTTLHGAVDANTAAGVDLTTVNIVVNSTITTTGSGIVNLSATDGVANATDGTVTLNRQASIVATGNVTITGNRTTGDAILVHATGAFTVSGNTITGQTRQFITTSTGASVTINSPMGLYTGLASGYDTFVINTKDGGGDITLLGAVDANYSNFTLNAGSGTVTSGSDAALTEVNNLTLNDNTSDASGTVDLYGSLSVEWIDTFPQPYTVNLFGSSNIVGPHLYYRYGNGDSTTFLNQGGVTLGDNASDYFWFRQYLTSTAPNTSVAGRIEAEGTLTFNNVTLLDTTSIISLGGGSVVMADLNGAGMEMRFGENPGGQMSYTITGAATLGTVTTYPYSTYLAISRVHFLGHVTVSTATTFENDVVQLGDGSGDDQIAFPAGLSLAPVVTQVLGGRISTTAAPVTLGDVTLVGTSKIDTGIGGANGDIALGRVSGSYALTLDAGDAGDSTIHLGAMTYLGAGLTIRAASGAVTLGELGFHQPGPVSIVHALAGVTFSGRVIATTLSLSGLTSGKNVIFADGQSVSLTALNTAVGAYNVTIHSDAFRVANDTTFANTGTLILGNSATDGMTFAGGLDTTAGPTVVNVAGILATTNTQMDLGAITLTADTRLDTSLAGSATLNVGAVTAAAYNLTLDSGSTANTTLASITGTGALNLAAGQQMTVTGDANLGTGSVKIDAITGAAVFSGTLTAATLTTSEAPYSVQLLGNTTITNLVTFRNTAGVTLGDSGDNLTFNGGLISLGSTTSIYGTILTTNDATQFAAVTLSGPSTIDTGNGVGNITMTGLTAGAHAVSLIAGTGTIAVTGTVTGTSTLTVQESGATGSVSFSGPVTLGGLTTTADAYAISFTGATTTFTSAVSLLNTGGVTLGDGGDVLTFNGGLTSKASTTTLNGSLVTSSDLVDLGTLLLAGTSSITTAGGNLLGTTVNGLQNLTLSSGAGDISFTGALGATAALQTLTISTARDVSFGSTLRVAGAMLQSAGTGTTTLRGTTGTGLGSLTLTTSAVVFDTASTIVVGNVSVTAATTLTVSNTLDAGSSTIALTAGTGYTQGTTGSVITRSTAIPALSLNVASGPAVLGSLSATSGRLTVSASGNITDANTTAVNVAGATIVLTSTGGSIGTSGDPIEYASPAAPTATASGSVNLQDIATSGGGTGGAAIARLDFGGSSGYTATGFTHVRGTAIYKVGGAVPYGFTAQALENQLTTTAGYSRSTVNLYRDAVMGRSSSSTFRYTLADGNYAVRIYAGHLTTASQLQVQLEGTTTLTTSVLSANTFTTLEFTNVAVTGGTLDIVLRNPTGYTGYWFVNGLEIAAVGQLPTVAPQMLDGLTFDEDGMEDASRQRLDQVNQTGSTLTPALVDEFKLRAIANWKAAGLTPSQVAQLTSSTIQISDLDSDGALGLTGSSTIVLDDDALGYGWYVGAMSETVPDGTMDLLTVLTHEMGHVLGLSDLDGQQTPDRLMAGTLQPGQRRTVTAVDLPAIERNTAERTIGAISAEQRVADLFTGTAEAVSQETTAATRIATTAEGIILRPTVAVHGTSSAERSSASLTTGQGTVHVVPVKSRDDLDLLDNLFADAITALGGLD